MEEHKIKFLNTFKIECNTELITYSFIAINIFCMTKIHNFFSFRITVHFQKTCKRCVRVCVYYLSLQRLRLRFLNGTFITPWKFISKLIRVLGYQNYTRASTLSYWLEVFVELNSQHFHWIVTSIVMFKFLCYIKQGRQGFLWWGGLCQLKYVMYVIWLNRK